MPTRAEQLYEQLKDAAAVKALIDQCEDSHLDCKEWPSKDEDAQKMVAKAACGFTNAEGGVLVIGMKAESKPKDEPDVISAAAPVKDTTLINSRVLNLIGNLVEPGIVGVLSKEIKERKGTESGFVIVLVPASEGNPRRSRKDSKFYRRIGSGTFPMEYSQIKEDMFGKRPHPKLSFILELVGIQLDGRLPQRCFRLGLKNVGRGIARFPSIRFLSTIGIRPDSSGLDGNGRDALPLRASEHPWIIYQGGIDSVIYPGETFMVAKLVQDGEQQDKVPLEWRNGLWARDSRNAILWRFKKIDFLCEISCEEMQTTEERASFEAENYRQEIV